jgi:hypothetical protein
MEYVEAEFVKKKQKQHEAQYWKVFDSSGKSTIDRNDSDIGLSASMDALEEALQEIKGDLVIVKLYQNKPERRESGITAETGLTFKVKLSSGGSGAYQKQSNHYQHSSVPQISWMDMIAANDKLRAAEIEKLKLEMELDRQEHPMMTALYKAMENPIAHYQGIGMMIGGIMNRNQISAPDNSMINDVQSLGIDLQKAIGKLKQNPEGAKIFADGIKKMANEE